MREIVSLLTGRLRATVDDYLLLAVFGILAAVLLLTAYAALVYAAALAIAAEAGPIVAALSIAGGSTLIALLLWLGLHLRRRRLRRRLRMRTQATASVASNAALATMIPMMVRASPVGSLVAVGIVAYVLSRAGQGGHRN
jgi:hypothetical protein